MASYMASSVQVLCPNGQRQNVEVTPNTKLLQILDEVCLKQGFQPVEEYDLQILDEVCLQQGFQPVEEYDLRHGEKTLDRTLIYRYSGLPYNARLKLVKAEKKRAEESVQIAVQLDTGERLLDEFSPSASLSEVLNQWKDQTVIKPGLQRVCVYFGEEIIGEYALSETNLRKLGLIRGKGLLRLVHREVDDVTLTTIGKKIAAEKIKMAALVERQTSVSATTMETTTSLDGSTSSENKSRPEPMETDDTKVVSSASELATKQTVPTDETASSMSEGARANSQRGETQAADIQFSAPGSNEHIIAPCDRETVVYSMDEAIPSVDELSDIYEHAECDIHRLQREAEEIEGFHFSTPGSNEHLPPYVRAYLQGFGISGDNSTPLQFRLQALACDAPSSGTTVEPFTQEFKPCDRETVVYSVDEVRPSEMSSGDDLPDGFFELTEADMHILWSGLRKQLESNQVMPAVMRHQTYSHVIVRVRFPESIVLQGVFSAREPVHALYTYVKEHLDCKTREFYLCDATSPGNILKRHYNYLKDQTLNLLEANLAPTCVLHFRSETTGDANISTAVLSEKATQQIADQIARKHLSNVSSTTDSDYAMASTSGESKRVSSRATNRSNNAGNASTASAEPSKVPK